MKTPSSNTTNERRSVAFVSFDCAKAEDIEERPEAANSVRISKWMAGGPGGATWNATDLLCFADIETSCAQGELSAVLRVGQQRVVERKTTIEWSGPHRVLLSAPERAWKGGLDMDKTGAGQSFRTAVFSLWIELSCSKPIEVGSGEVVFGETADSRAFVAGFASGE